MLLLNLLLLNYLSFLLHKLIQIFLLLILILIILLILRLILILKILLLISITLLIQWICWFLTFICKTFLILAFSHWSVPCVFFVVSLLATLAFLVFVSAFGSTVLVFVDIFSFEAVNEFFVVFLLVILI